MSNDEPISVIQPRITESPNNNVGGEIISLDNTSDSPPDTSTILREILPPTSLFFENSVSTSNIRFTPSDSEVAPISLTSEFEGGFRANLEYLGERNDRVRSDLSRAAENFLSIDPRSWLVGLRGVASVTSDAAVGGIADGIAGELHNYSEEPMATGLTLPETRTRPSISYSDPFDYTALAETQWGNWRVGIGWSQPEHMGVADGRIVQHEDDAYALNLRRPLGNNTAGGRNNDDDDGIGRR
jgi:hypothetical protein